MSDFHQLGLPDGFVRNLSALGINTMTAIQASALPPILAGKDVLGKAKTGSGKTATFALGFLSGIDISFSGIQALVMCPTRELAEQVAEEIRRLGKPLENLKVLTLCGGAPMGPQISSLRHGAQVVVGTPGRLMAHIVKGRLNLSAIKTLVLDEADRMLDMGFQDELDAVVKSTPVSRQTLLFSATYPAHIKAISARIQRNPVDVSVEEATQPNITQVFYQVEESQRVKTAAAALTHYQPQRCIVFCNTKAATRSLAEELNELGFSALALHGELEQSARTQVLARFANLSCQVLVATDVAARGLDIDDLDMVLNYQVSFDPETHVHRIGRTGRAEKSGIAITLCSNSEINAAHGIEEAQGKALTWKGFQSLRFHGNRIVEPQFQTICIDGGKKAKLRPGDILGALTKDAGIPGEDIGKIQVTATHTFVALKIRSVKRGVKHVNEGKIKGRRFKARRLK